MKRMIFVTWMFLLIAIKINLWAGFVRASTSDSVSHILARSPYSLILFYDKSKENIRDVRMRDRIKNVEEMFTSLSKNPDYVEAELMFIRVDVSRRDLASVAQRYRVQTTPAIRLFLGNELVGQLEGSIYRPQLQAAIDQHFKTQMQRTIEEKARKRERDYERAKIQAAYWAPYWYGSPYWGYGYYPYWNGPYWGPNYGFYVGW